MKLPMVAVAVVLTLLGLPTIASAQSGNVIYACIGNDSKVVRIVGAGGSCISFPKPKVETPVQWNIQGPQGLPGTNGTNGTSVTITGALPKGDAHCSNGGVTLTDGTGIPYYLCNGADGTTIRAAGPCFDNTNRYVNCGNGTVTDTVTGLIWLKHADCLPPTDWASANQAAAGLKDGLCALTDRSSPGDWRLPTRAEWAATIRQAAALGCVAGTNFGFPALTNDAGTACYGNGSASSFVGVVMAILHPFDGYYWSSSTVDASPLLAWNGVLINGDTNIANDKVLL